MKTSNVEGHGSKATDATRGRRSTLLAGAKGQVWRDSVTESVGQIRDMTVVGLTFIDNEDGTGVLIAGDGTGGGIGGEPGSVLPAVNAPLVCNVSNPPTQAELETCVGAAASEVSGQAYIVTDSDTGLDYVVWSTGDAFGSIPIVQTSGDLSTVALTNGIFSDFTPQVAAAAYDSVSGKVFWTYINGAGDAAVSSWDGASVVTSVLRAALDPGDLHAQPALLVRSSDRKVIVAYSAHVGSTVYVRISSSAADVSAFGAEASLDATIGGTDYTYPVLIELSDAIYLFIRTYTGTTPGGQFNHAGAIWSYSKSTDNGATWSARTNVMSDATYGMYWMPTKTADDRVDFSVCDRSTFDATGGSAFHMYMLAGGTFYTTDGTEITATKPFNQTALTQVRASDGTQAAAPGTVRMVTPGIPRMAWRVAEDISPEDFHYYWAKWDAVNGWDAQEVAAAGSGSERATSSFVDAYTIWYTKDDGSGVSQVHRITTPDDGDSWVDRQITDSAVEQSRLAAIQNRTTGLAVLWMDGYTNDSTSTTITGASFVPAEGAELQRIVALDGAAVGDGLLEVVWRVDAGVIYWSDDLGATWNAAGGGAIDLDDLTDVTITAPAEDDTLRYVGGVWINDNRRWEPVTTNPGTGPELVWDGDEILMNWAPY